VPAHEVDDALEQLQPLLGLADAATDDDHLPRPLVERVGDDRLDVVAPVEAEQAGLRPDPGISEPRHAESDRLRYRCGVPRPGHPVRVEPDHQDARLRSGAVHPVDASGPVGS
jgi:hypothetical protein